MKQGEMEVVCLSQTYQVALCCLLHHDLRQYCAPYNGCNRSHTCMGQGIGHFRTRNGLSLRRREPVALMYSLLVDKAELLFRRYLCMCKHSVALFAVACVLVVWCIPKPVQ